MTLREGDLEKKIWEEEIPLNSLLFQAGYKTIKNIEEMTY